MIRTELLKILKLAQPALLAESEQVLPILKNFKFESGRVTATNEVIAVSLEADIDQDGIVPGRKLVTFLNSASGKTVKVSRDKSDNIVFSCGRGRFTLAPDDEDDWPFEFPDIEEATPFDVGEGFFTALSVCSSQSPDTGVGSWVGGIWLEFGKTDLEVYGIDKDRITISYFRVPKMHKMKGKISIMLPSSFCKTAVAMSKEFGQEARLHLINGGAVIEWEDSRYILFGKALDVEAPDIVGRFWQVVDNNEARVTIDEKLEAVFKRAAALGDESGCHVSNHEKGLLFRANTGVSKFREVVPFGEEGNEKPNEFLEDVDYTIAASMIAKRIGDCAEIAFTEDAVVMRSEEGHFIYLVANRTDKEV